jgi:hypothetical protein
MTNKNYIQLIHFALRIPMYAIKEEKNTIVAFIQGYDFGNTWEFIHGFSEWIADRCKIEKRATGWAGQIDRLAKRRKKEWVVVFKKEALKFLVSKLDEEGLNELQESFGETWFAKNFKKYISSL